MAQHIWRRCPDCGRLSLVQYGRELACSCGRQPATAPHAAPFRLAPARPNQPDRPEATPLSPAENATALRLLAQALPNGPDV